MHKHRAKGFVPPYDAYVSEFDADVTEIANVYVGIQDRGAPAATALAHSELAALFTRADAPDWIERGWCEEPAGARTVIHPLYWRDPKTFRRWWNDTATRDWFLQNEALHGDVGRWAELLFPQTKLLDTLLAHPEKNFGIARLAKENVLTPYHGYWGGMRDRMEALDDDRLQNPAGDNLGAQRQVRVTLGRRVCVEMPANVCFARGGPDWSESKGEEREVFLNDVYPALVTGAKYLATSSQDAGCYSCRLVHETDRAGAARDQVNALTYYVTLRNLENWTARHPTHLAIYGKFLAMLRRIGRMPDVLLDHEISVLPRGKLRGVYVNCDARTGFASFGAETPDSVQWS